VQTGRKCYLPLTDQFYPPISIGGSPPTKGRPVKRKEQPTIDDCRKAYWAACARYEGHRTDPYSTWRQINDAAADVAIARDAWLTACQHAPRIFSSTLDRRLDAARSVCSETGEDVTWVANYAKRK